MDIKRLEELASLATTESKYFTYRGPCKAQDLRDLARCAAAWAKLERAMQGTRHGIELFGYKGRAISWAYLPANRLANRAFGQTAIEAVEAAE